MSTHPVTLHLVDRVRMRPEASSFLSGVTSGVMADGANARITVGAFARRDRPVGDDVDVAVVRPAVGAVVDAAVDAVVGAAVDAAVAEVRVAPLSTLPPTPAAWVGHDDARLLEFLVERYHRPLREELPRLQALAARARLDGPGDDEVQARDHRRAARLLDDLAALLIEHLDEEEQALFPAILEGDPLEHLAHAALDDHQVALRLLGELRRLCQTSTSSSDPLCRALAHGLFTLERELIAHIALETDVLWPRLRARPRSAAVSR